MRFPDAVTILRSSTQDAYGDPGWATPTEIPAKAFVTPEGAYLPPTTDIRTGDRLRVPGRGTFTVDGEPTRLRSPSRLIMWHVELTRIPGTAA